MGDKTAARAIAVAGRGAGGARLRRRRLSSDADPAAEAARVGYPVLIKASARRRRQGHARRASSPASSPTAFAGARREARGRLRRRRACYLEKYVQRPRHIEIQILADAHGNVVHLGERECSIQRRHQKIIEESPSPALSPELRARHGRRRPCAAARAAGYVNAGTVEFLLDPDGSFYFLEMNTRLQVEHPVTELVTGLDLVRLQIAHRRRARRCRFTQEDVTCRGHAIECRIYAEDPVQLPARRRAGWPCTSRRRPRRAGGLRPDRRRRGHGPLRPDDRQADRLGRRAAPPRSTGCAGPWRTTRCSG